MSKHAAGCVLFPHSRNMEILNFRPTLRNFRLTLSLVVRRRYSIDSLFQEREHTDCENMYYIFRSRHTQNQ